MAAVEVDGGDGTGASESGGAGEATDRGRRPFYINVVVLNKDQVVAEQVGKKIGGPFGLTRRLATAVAQRAVKDEALSAKVAAGLAEQLPAAVAELGIELDMASRMVSGALSVMRCELKGADMVALVRKAKDEEFARHFQNMMDAFDHMGLPDAKQTVQDKVLGLATSAIMEKLVDQIPAKLKEKVGLAVEVSVQEVEDQAEFVFCYLEAAHSSRT